MTSTYLARLTLNPRSRQVALDLRDANLMHKRTASLFPNLPDVNVRSAYNLLYRIESTPEAPILLLQSTGAPINRSALPGGYAQVECREITPLLGRLKEGMVIRYRLDAAAEVDIKNEDDLRAIATRRASAKKLQNLEADAYIRDFVTKHRKGRGVRQRLTGEAATRWWTRKAQGGGIAPITVLDTPGDAVTGRRTDGWRATRYSPIRFEGAAEVTDAEALRHAIRQGIGQGKPYGAGLLSIAPTNFTQE